jgi:hypothetical protein
VSVLVVYPKVTRDDIPEDDKTIVYSFLRIDFGLELDRLSGKD